MTESEPWRAGGKEAAQRAAETAMHEAFSKPPWFRRREVWLIAAGFVVLAVALGGLWIRGTAESRARADLTSKLEQPVYITVPYRGGEIEFRCRLLPEAVHGKAHYFCATVKTPRA